MKWLASMALAGGMAVATTGAASAQEWRWGHVDNDYARIADMRNDIARDRAQLDEDIRCGRQDRAAHDAADLARDQRALQAMRADVHRDIRRGYDGDDDRGYDNGYYRGYDNGYNGNGYYRNDGYYRGYSGNWR